MPQIQGQTGTGQLVQNTSSSDMFGYQSGLNNFNSSIFSSNAGMYNSQQANSSSPWGSILGGAAGSATGAFGTAMGTAAFAAL
jgi:hypothetical protein